MNKNEFLRVLREQLEGSLSQNTIEGHIRYYDQYITEQIRNGKTEEQVMEELGSPVFIAKTLTDVATGSESAAYSEEEGYNEDSYYGEQEETGRFKNKVHTFVLNSGLARILFPLAIILVLFVATFVLGAVAVVAFRFFFPILLVIWIFYLFQNFRGR